MLPDIADARINEVEMQSSGSACILSYCTVPRMDFHRCPAWNVDFRVSCRKQRGRLWGRAGRMQTRSGDGEVGTDRVAELLS
jgi:hypothetical protein